MEIYNFKAFAVILSDQSMWADVLLQDFTLEDTRSIRKSGVTRFVTSKKRKKNSSAFESVIHVFYIIKFIYFYIVWYLFTFCQP